MATMRAPFALITTVLLLAGCGQAGSPTAALLMTPGDPASVAGTSLAAATPLDGTAIAEVAPTMALAPSNAAAALTPGAMLVSNNGSSFQAEPALPGPITSPHYVESDEPTTFKDKLVAFAEDPASLQPMPASAPSGFVSNRCPYGVVLVTRSAHTATIAWATELPTKGTIEYGRTWGFNKHGFTATFNDDVAKTDHRITLTGLHRFARYTFRVSAIDALGLTFHEQSREFRTKFWSWR